MSKRIVVERLYSLGDYKNIKFTYEISELPDNENIDNKIKEAFATIENGFLEYKVFSEDLRNSETVEGAFNYIQNYLNSISQKIEEE